MVFVVGTQATASRTRERVWAVSSFSWTLSVGCRTHCCTQRVPGQQWHPALFVTRLSHDRSKRKILQRLVEFPC